MIPSMGGREIGQYLREWAAEAECGQAIVELGVWLGAGTVQMAGGAKKGVVIHAFDRYEASSSEIKKAATQGTKIKGDTSHYVEKHFKSLGHDNIVLHKTDIRNARWDNTPISLYVDDACKRKDAFDKALSIFSKSWIPGKTIVVLMDYWYFKKKKDDGLKYQYEWMSINKKCFEPVMLSMPGTSSAAFRYLGGL